MGENAAAIPFSAGTHTQKDIDMGEKNEREDCCLPFLSLSLSLFTWHNAADHIFCRSKTFTLGSSLSEGKNQQQFLRFRFLFHCEQTYKKVGAFQLELSSYAALIFGERNFLSCAKSSRNFFFLSASIPFCSTSFLRPRYRFAPSNQTHDSS